MTDTKGIIYVLVNRAMPDYIKVGITNNLRNRLSQLDNTSVPLPFVCVYAVKVSDHKAKEQAILKSLGHIEGIRVRSNREFLRTKPATVITFMKTWDNAEVIVDLDDNIGSDYISGMIGKDAEQDIIQQEKINERRSSFRFDNYDIPVGTELKLIKDNSITCKVSENNKVVMTDDADGELLSLSKAAEIELKKMDCNWSTYNGYEHWSLDGDESLTKYRERMDDINNDDD